MFSHLGKGAHVQILDIVRGVNGVEDDVVISDGVVEQVSSPHIKDAQQGANPLLAVAMGQQQELVVDLVVSTATGQRTFRNVPHDAAVDRGGQTIITESKELMSTEIDRLMKISQEHIAATPWHEKALPKYDKIQRGLNPAYAKEQERDAAVSELQQQYKELKAQNEELKSGMGEILAFVRGGAQKADPNLSKK